MKKAIGKILIILVCLSSQGLAQNASPTPQNYKQNDFVMPNFGPFNKFYAKAAEFTGSQKVNLSKDYRIHIKSEFEKGNILDGKLSFESSSAEPALIELLGDFLVAVNESGVLKLVAFESKNETINGADININSSEADFYFKLNFSTNSPQTAENVARRFRLLFVIAQKVMDGHPEAEFYKTGSIEAEKNQIFIATKISRNNLKKFLSH